MPFAIQCPSCKRKLNVPDKVAGKRIKCPGCGEAFLAAAPESEFVEPEPAEMEAVGRPVEDDDDEDRPRPKKRDADAEHVSATPQRRRPREDDERVSSKPQARRRNPRDDDDEDDERESKPRRSRDDDDNRPRRRRRDDDEDDDDYDVRRRRRRAVPHRGTLILTLGIITIPAALCCVLAGLIMAAITTNMARADFTAMRSGHMDDEGYGMTMAGNICAFVGFALALLNCVTGIILQVTGVLRF